MIHYLGLNRDHHEKIHSSHPSDGLPILWLPQWKVQIVWNPSSLLEWRSHHSQYHEPAEIIWKQS
jgi:hypothetical protein